MNKARNVLGLALLILLLAARAASALVPAHAGGVGCPGAAFTATMP